MTARLPLCAVAVAGLFFPAGAAAQLVSDAPRLHGPHAPSGFGMYWLRGGALPGDGDGLLVTWAPASLRSAVVFRGGAGTGVAGTPAGFAGVDVRVPITADRHLLDVSWNAGVGASLGEYLLGTLPMGLSAGHEWSSGAISFAPYVAGGLALDIRFGEEAPEEEFVVQPTGEVGVDLSLDAARRVTLRAAVGLGERGAVAVGAAVQGRR
jgi:hypothetical protein